MLRETKGDVFIVDPTTVQSIGGGRIEATSTDGNSRFISAGLIGDIVFCLPRRLSDEEVKVFRGAEDVEKVALRQRRTLADKLLGEYLSIHPQEELVLGVAVKLSARPSISSIRGVEYLHSQIGVWQKSQ